MGMIQIELYMYMILAKNQGTAISSATVKVSKGRTAKSSISSYKTLKKQSIKVNSAIFFFDYPLHYFPASRKLKKKNCQNKM